MLKAICGGLLVLACLGGSPATVQAQWFGRCFNPCVTCRRPAVNYSCSSSAARMLPPLTQTHVQPVVSTQYRQQQQVSYRDVPQTQYRQEARYESVPVTTYENVTVDEGGYQQVWVPNLVTKSVAKQGYQSQLTYRSVPYQVTQRIPEVTTQYIPEQRTSYLATKTTSYLPPVTTAWQSSAYSSSYTASLLPPLTTPIVSAPIQRAPIAAVPRRRTARNGPVPDPGFERSVRTSASGRRTATNDPYDGYRPAAPSRRKPVRSAKRFVPAPSAAAVWRTPRGSVYR